MKKPTPKSAVAIIRELHQIERWLRLVRHRYRHYDIADSRDEIRLAAARQALAWAAGRSKMSMSRIATLNEQEIQRLKRRRRRAGEGTG